MDQVNDLTLLSLEELANLEITSVAKKPQRLVEAAAAVYVITQEDLRRSGVTNIPDALRMVPGVQVARIDANKWAVSARGFNARFSNKLLVLLDGRAVYTPSFSGVYWEVQDTVLADIERIEVIRGPGATVWGANAVNGVVNIITKKASETQGGLVEVALGTDDPGLTTSTRYGGRLGNSAAYRLYAKGSQRQAGQMPDGDSTQDEWHKLQAGFRTDWDGSEDGHFTLQGDIYQGQANGLTRVASGITVANLTFQDDIEFSGGNLLARWQNDSTSAQLYYDFTERKETAIDQKRHTVDLELQHRFSWGTRQEITLGAGYRISADDLDSTEFIAVDDEQAVDHLFSGFAQDEITLWAKRLTLTLGSKFEHNDYTGFEVQPSARLLYTPTEHHSFWTSVSRAVRTPSRAEESGQINTSVLQVDLGPGVTRPVLGIAQGNGDFESEELLAFEAGYRYFPGADFSLDVAAFFNRYDNLRTAEEEPQIPVGGVAPFFIPDFILAPLRLDNKMEADAFGVELAGEWQPMDRWRLRLAYTLFVIDYDLKGDSQDLGQLDLVEGTDPNNQLSLQSSWDLPRNLKLDLWFRFVDELEGPQIDIDSYLTADIRLAWEPKPELELSVVGQNLLGGGHLEFDPEVGNPEFELRPGVYGMVRWLF